MFSKALVYTFTAIAILYSSVYAAGNITIINADGPGEGLNDQTAATPVTGNPGTTVGQQRVNVYNAAAQFWANYLNNQVPIRVLANMDPLSCSANGGVLASAGPRTFAVNFPNAPATNTVYTIALAQELANAPGAANSYELAATFNSEVGTPNCISASGWSYVIGVAPSTGLSLYTTAIHEIAHGLGFLTLVSQNGVLATPDGVTFYDDTYMLNLVDDSSGTRWTNMSDAQRAASSISNDLAWDGAKVNAELSAFTAGQSLNGRAKIYSPSSFQGGSSVSHFDTSYTPNEIMEPFDTGDLPESVLSKALMCDIGWPCATAPVVPPVVPVPIPATTTLISPSGTITDTTPTYTWNAVSGATDYVLSVQNNSSGIAVVNNTTYSASATGCSAGAGTCSITPTTSLTPHNQYQWSIAGKNSSGQAPFITPNTFTINQPPTQPVSSDLSVSSGTYSAKIEVSWESVSNATFYEAYRCTSLLTSSCVQVYSGSDTSYDDTAAQSGVTYYYRIKACNTAGCSAFGNSKPGYKSFVIVPILLDYLLDEEG